MREKTHINMWLIIFLLFATGSSERLTPIIDAPVGVVAFPMPPLYVSTTSWTHIFSVPIICPSRILTTKIKGQVTKMLEATNKVYTEYIKLCTSESKLPSTQHEYICDLVRNEISLMNTTLVQFRSTVNKSMRIHSTYKSLRDNTMCEDVNLDFLVRIPLMTTTKADTVSQAPPTELPSSARRKRFADDIAASSSGTDILDVESTGMHSQLPSPNPRSVRPDVDRHEPHPIINHNYYVSGDQHLHYGSYDQLNLIPSATSTTMKPSSHWTPNNDKQQRSRILGSDTILERMQNDKSLHLEGARDFVHQAKSACLLDPLSGSTIAKLQSYKVALSTYMDSTGISYCEIVPSSTLCKHYHNDQMTQSHVSRQRREIKVTHGWIPWDFSVNKWIWGGLTSDDAKEVNHMFNTVQGELTDMTNRFVSVQNQTASAMSTLREELIDYSKQLAKRLDTLSSTSEAWGNDVEQVIQQLSDNTTITSILTLGALLLAQSGQVRDFLVNVKGTLETTNRDNEHIYSSVLAGSIPFQQITLTDMITTVTKVNKALPKTLKIVPSDKNQNIFHSLVPSCHSTDSGFMFYYTLPIITSDYDYKTWQISSIPVDTGILNMQVSLESTVVIISDSHDHWYKLSDSSYTACITNKARVCPFSPPHYSKKDPNCAVSLVMGSGRSREFCHMVANPGTRLSDIAVLPIDGRRWLVSTPLQGIPALLRCKSNTSGLLENKDETLKGIQLITLPGHCALKSSGVALISYDNSMYHSITHIGEEVIFMPNDLTAPSLQGYETVWASKLNVTTKLVRQKLENISTPVLELKMSGMSIRNITELISDNARVLNKTFSEIAHSNEEKDTNVVIKLPGILPTLTLPFSVTTFVLVQLVIDTVMLVAVLKSYCGPFNIIRNIHSNIKPDKFELDTFVEGVPIPSLREDHFQFNPFDEVKTPPVTTSTTTPIPTTMVGSTTPPMANHTLLSTMFKLDLKLDYLYKLIRSQGAIVPKYDLPLVNALKLPLEKENMHHFIWMVVIMVVLAIICHIAITSSVRRTIVNYLNRSSGVIMNELSLHHGPETKVIMSLIVRIYRNLLWKDTVDPNNCKNTKQLIMIQINTLPHTRTEYEMITQHSEKAFISCKPSNRFMRSIKAKINWGRYCVRLRDNESLDLCSEMANNIEIPMHEIIASFGRHVPWLWTHMEIVGMTHLILQDLGGTKVIYNAASDDGTAGAEMTNMGQLGSVSYIP